MGSLFPHKAYLQDTFLEKRASLSAMRDRLANRTSIRISRVGTRVAASARPCRLRVGVRYLSYWTQHASCVMRLPRPVQRELSVCSAHATPSRPATQLHAPI